MFACRTAGPTAPPALLRAALRSKSPAHPRLPALAVLCLVLPVAGLAGCASSMVAPTASFATAGAPTLIAARQAYALVQTVQAGAATAQRVSTWETTSVNVPPPAITFGTPQDIKTRDEILGLLSGYIADLAEATGSKSAIAANAGNKAAGEAMGTLAGDSLTASPQSAATATLTTPEMEAASAAITAIDRLLVARARRRALPRIVAEADGPVATLCGTLRRDFGTPTTPGLRNAVHTSYEQWITIEDAAIRDHASAYSYPEKRAAIERVFALQVQEREADATLAQADAALATFAAAHHALAQSATHGDQAEFRKRLGTLVMQAHQLQALEEKDTGATADRKVTP